jgi:uncharacterized membrane protein YfcA
MSLTAAAVLVLGGILCGFLAGWLGAGGAILMVPLLVVVLQNEGITSLVATHIAFGTALLTGVAMAVDAGITGQRARSVLWRPAAVMSAAGVVVAAGAGVLGTMLEGKTLQKIFSVVAALTAIQMVVGTQKTKGREEMQEGIPGFLGVGALSGALSGLAGVSFGLFTSPILYGGMKLPLMKARSTAVVAGGAAAGAAGVVYAVAGWDNVLARQTGGYVAWLYAIPLIACALPAVRLGVRVAARTTDSTARKITAVVLLIIATKAFFP